MNLQKYLIDNDLSGAEFARKGGWSRQVVSLWARGEAIPRPEQMPLISKLTGGDVQPGDFYNGPAEGAATA